MKIGLVRHYKVKKGFPEKRWLTYGELAQWFREYDESDIEEEATDLQGIQWGKCYSSDLPRASRTAKAIYEGPIACTDELREIPLPHFKLQMRLPFLCWAIIVRLSAYLSRDTREKIAEGEKRNRGDSRQSDRRGARHSHRQPRRAHDVHEKGTAQTGICGSVVSDSCQWEAVFV